MSGSLFVVTPQVLIGTKEALDFELTEEEVKHLEEPYLPNAILGHD